MIKRSKYQFISADDVLISLCWRSSCLCAHVFLTWSKLDKNIVTCKNFSHFLRQTDRFSWMFENGVLIIKVLCSNLHLYHQMSLFSVLLQVSAHCSGRYESVDLLLNKLHLGGFYRRKIKVSHLRRTFSHRVGPQRHPPPTASAKLGVAVRTQVPTAVCKLGLVADSTGGCIIAMDGGARRYRGLPDHRLSVAGQLLLDSPGREGRHDVKTGSKNTWRSFSLSLCNLFYMKRQFLQLWIKHVSFTSIFIKQTFKSRF